MISAVIFDFDGTLKKFNLDVKACRTEIIKRLNKYGIPSNLFSMDETAFDMLLKVKKYLNTNNNDDKILEIKKKVFSIVDDFELEAAKTTEFFPGVLEVLKSLKDLKIKVGLCTISGEKATKHQLGQFGLGKSFDAVITRDDVKAVKPHPDHLRNVLNVLKVVPQNALLVGDSVKDVSCAKQIGVLAVGVTTGLSSADELIKSGAHYIVSSVLDIPKLVMQLNNWKTK